MLKQFSKKTGEEAETTSLMPILSLMLILIPILVGNIAFSSLRAFRGQVPDQSVRNEQSSPLSKDTKPIFLIRLEAAQLRLTVIDESTGVTIEENLLDRNSTQKELSDSIKGLVGTYQESDTVLIKAERKTPYTTLISTISTFENQLAKENKKMKLVVLPLERI